MFEKNFLMSLLCLVVVLNVSATATRGANILFVSSMTAVEDDALKAFMEGLGHTVTYIDDDEDEETTEAAAAAADLVFISESVGSGGIKNEITEIETPMIVGEPWAWDEMGLTEGSGGDDPAVTTDAEIVDPGHYLAAGLSGSVDVLTEILEGGNLGKGVTGPEATVIATATLSDTVTYDVIFVYEKGAALPVAPADGSAQIAADIRIGFGFHSICYPVLSENAYALLGAAVDYALGLTGPPPTVPFSLGAAGDITIGNDARYGPDQSSNGSGLEARDIPSRRHVVLISYDISALKGRGPVSNVSFSHFSHDQHGQTNVYGIIEALDILDVESLTWNTAPGVQNDPTPELDSPIALDLNDLTDVLVTFEGPGETGVRFSTDTSQALADFINSDTDGIVTFLVSASAENNQLIIRARTHSAGGSFLEGEVLLPAPVKLDFQDSDDPNNVEEGFMAFTFADSGLEIDDITVTLGEYGEADTRRRGEPNGVPYENIYKDFIFARQAEAGVGYVTVTLSGLKPEGTYGITIYSYDTSSNEIRVTDWSANGEVLLTTIADNTIPPVEQDDQAFTGMATADANGVIFMEAVPGEGTFAAEPFAFINALVISPIYIKDSDTDGLVVDQITSPSLEGNLLGDPATREVIVYLPPSYNQGGNFPVVYLLHGYTGNART
ncbi:MAG: alpha/beta hydrolase [Planctomycetota bacterium]